MDGVVQVLNEFAKISDTWHWVVHHIAEPDGGAVLTERSDKILTPDGQWHSFDCMGVFELRNGRICAWRDYYDSRRTEAVMNTIIESLG